MISLSTPSASEKVSKVEQFRRTQRALLDAARELFMAHGYGGTSTEAVLQRAGVTRGALYYHYRDKADLFEAVFDEVRDGFARTIGEKMQAEKKAGGDAWQQLMVCCHAFVEDAASSPCVQRIIHIEGPAVLGSNIAHKEGAGRVILHNLFTQLMAENVVSEMPLKPLIHMVRGAFFEAGVYIANAGGTVSAQREMLVVLTHMFAGLRPRPTNLMGGSVSSGSSLL